MVITELSLDLVPQGVSPHVHVKQNDNGTRTIRVSLYNGGNVYTPASTDTMVIQGVKPDGNLFVIQKDASSEYLDFILTQQATSAAGKAKCELKITDNSGTVRTIDFNMFIEATAIGSAVFDESTLEAYEQIVEQAEQAASAAAESASAADAAKTAAANVQDYVRGVVDNAADELRTAVGQLLFPVGSIFLSVSSSSPANFLGGTWVRIKDTFLLAAGDTYAAGNSGGSATHTHSLDNSSTYACVNMDTNALYLNRKTGADVLFASEVKKTVEGTMSAASVNNTQAAKLKGNTSAGSTLPPYLAVYVWKRTA